MKVFISYSRLDAGFVERLDRALSEIGHDVWVDTVDIFASGKDCWRTSIVVAIRESEAVVLVLSPNSTRSQNVERELSVAAENGKRVIPVMYESCVLPDGFQYELAGVQHVDFGALEFDEGIAQLASHLGPPEPVPFDPVPPDPGPQPDRISRWRDSRVLAFAGVVVAVVVVGGFVVASTSADDGRAETHYSFAVRAKENCVSEGNSSDALDTGLRFAAGTTITVIATGRWRSGESTHELDRESGPDGQTRQPGGELSAGTLVGYLDQDPIGLGSRAVVRSAGSNATLRLGFWDFSEFCDDNAGSVQVDVLAVTR